MSKLDLKIRKLETGEVLYATFEHENDAMTWLRERPDLIEVLGVATHGLPKELYTDLKAAMRPMNSAERVLVQKLDDAERLAIRMREVEELKREIEEQEAHRVALRGADPDRPMSVRWTAGGAIELMDPADERAVTAEARAAVEAWVAERAEWIKDREQVVDEAQVTVWPGPLPAGKTERVQPGGQFFPAPAPAPKKA